MSRVNIAGVSQGLEALTDEERRALRASRFHSASAPAPPARPSSARLAHPGGPLTTNKAAALAKFLKRKLDEPGGAESLDPSLVERAVQNAKISTRSATRAAVRHVDSFSDSEEVSQEERVTPETAPSSKKRKQKKRKAVKAGTEAVTPPQKKQMRKKKGKVSTRKAKVKGKRTKK